MRRRRARGAERPDTASRPRREDAIAAATRAARTPVARAGRNTSSSRISSSCHQCHHVASLPGSAVPAAPAVTTISEWDYGRSTPRCQSSHAKASSVSSGCITRSRPQVPHLPRGEDADLEHEPGGCARRVTARGTQSGRRLRPRCGGLVPQEEDQRGAPAPFPRSGSRPSPVVADETCGATQGALGALGGGRVRAERPRARHAERLGHGLRRQQNEKRARIARARSRWSALTREPASRRRGPTRRPGAESRPRQSRRGRAALAAAVGRSSARTRSQSASVASGGRHLAWPRAE